MNKSTADTVILQSVKYQDSHITQLYEDQEKYKLK